MNNSRRCKNFLRGTYSKECNVVIESDRPKSAKYCKACGQRRSHDWKREHIERVKSYDNDEAVRKWRESHNWNRYIQDHRERDHEKYREQNNRHVREHRARKQEKSPAVQVSSYPDISAQREPADSSGSGGSEAPALAANALSLILVLSFFAFIGSSGKSSTPALVSFLASLVATYALLRKRE